MCSGCHGRWDSSSLLGISAGNDKYVQATLCCFEKWSHNIHCDKSSGLDSKKAADCADGSTWGCFLRSMGMCLLYGRQLWPYRAGKPCDVVYRTREGDRDVQQAIADVTPLVCVYKAIVGLRSEWRPRQLIVVREVCRS